MEPTEEETKRFWEWCGFKHDRGMYAEWTYPTGEILTGEPPIDLNNLFKWAVPKLFTWSIGKNWDLEGDMSIKENGVKASIDLKPVDPDKYDEIKPSEAISEDPALALFWAIYKVME